MPIEIGTRCEVINAQVPKNNGLQVIVVGDAGIRKVGWFGDTQCYFVDRELVTQFGHWRNWSSEKQLRPLPPACEVEGREIETTA